VETDASAAINSLLMQQNRIKHLLTTLLTKSSRICVVGTADGLPSFNTWQKSIFRHVYTPQLYFEDITAICQMKQHQNYRLRCWS